MQAARDETEEVLERVAAIDVANRFGTGVHAHAASAEPGQRLARGRRRVKRAARVEALNGQFDDHHAELARLLLDQIDALNAQIERLTARVDARSPPSLSR